MELGKQIKSEGSDYIVWSQTPSLTARYKFSGSLTRANLFLIKPNGYKHNEVTLKFVGKY